MNPPLRAATAGIWTPPPAPAVLALFMLFAAAVYVVQGSEPALGSDHLSYIQTTQAIQAACPDGDYWREIISIRTFPVLLSYLNTWSGSYIVSMKVLLAICTVLYLLAAQLFFNLFTPHRWQAILFALLSAFAVSFGIASWGVTDSTALLPRSLVAPIIMLAMWLWMRDPRGRLKYLAFPLLFGASLLHLSTFYLAGVLLVMEAWDWAARRKLRFDGTLAAFAGAMAASAVLLFALEIAGVSTKIIGVQIPVMMRSMGFNVPNLERPRTLGCPGEKREGLSLAPPAPARHTRVARLRLHIRAASVGPVAVAAEPPTRTGGDTAARSAKEAWEIELRLRPWRNMPLPWVNVLNALSSSALILLMSFGGIWVARREGFNDADRVMAAMFVAVPIVALLPQTILWVLRSFTAIYPATIEEVRAISLLMIPALYFVLRLFRRATRGGGRRAIAAGTAIALGVVSLPLFMKNLPNWAREGLLSAMAYLRVVDESQPSSLVNARAALGLSSQTPLYYASENVRRWLQLNTPPGSRILTTQDDIILVRDRAIIGTRQSIATAFYASEAQTQVFLEASKAVADRDLDRLQELAAANRADYIVAPWQAPGALYWDGRFAVVAARHG